MKSQWGVLGAIGVLLGILVVMAIGKRVGGAAADAVGERKDEIIEQALQVSAEQMRAALPIRVDAQTTVVDVSVSGKQIVYMHRLSGVRAADVTEAQLVEFAAGMNTRACGNAQTRNLLDRGGVMTYAYRDDAGAAIGELSLTADSCTDTAKPRVARGTVPVTTRSTAKIRPEVREALRGQQLTLDRCNADRAAAAAKIPADLPAEESQRAYEAVNARYMACMQG